MMSRLMNAKFLKWYELFILNISINSFSNTWKCGYLKKYTLFMLFILSKHYIHIIISDLLLLIEVSKDYTI